MTRHGSNSVSCTLRHHGHVVYPICFFLIFLIFLFGKNYKWGCQISQFIILFYYFVEKYDTYIHFKLFEF